MIKVLLRKMTSILRDRSLTEDLQSSILATIGKKEPSGEKRIRMDNKGMCGTND